MDKAAKLLTTEGRIYVSAEENKRVLRKIDLVILPLLLIIYCLQSYASMFGLITDTHLHGEEHSWLGSIVYVAQLLMQPLVSFLLVKVPIGKSISVMVFVWGALLCGMVGAKNFGGLMATRFLLGAAGSCWGVVWSDHSKHSLIQQQLLLALQWFRCGIGEANRPLIVKSFGFDSFTTILFNIPFGAVQLVATLGGAFLATKLKQKSPVLIVLYLPPTAGLIMLMVIDHDKRNRGALLAGYCLISVYPGISSLIYSWSAQNTASESKCKVTTGILFVGASAGNIIGPHLFNPSEAPRYSRGLRSNLALFCTLIALFCLGIAYITVLNKKHAASERRWARRWRWWT